jgi:heme/copper-type cytochrome/quinol oxidase subunit 2
MTSNSYENAPAAPTGAAATDGAGMATAALVLGILAIVTCWTVIGGVLLGVLAIAFGVVAARRAGRGEARGHGRAVTGIVTGAIGLLLAVALIAFGVSILNRTSTKNLEHCLKNANGNQSAVQQCQQKYKDDVNNGK